MTYDHILSGATGPPAVLEAIRANEDATTLLVTVSRATEVVKKRVKAYIYEGIGANEVAHGQCRLSNGCV
jgi:hypothetical protein